MYTHLFVKQPQRCNGQRVDHDLISLGRRWARFQIPVESNLGLKQ
jgi:hypothetical protein